ncbi:MAG: phosphoribosylaminoimidazolesuccinocarboxamide synthase [Candidatus Omnitrophota bacterium]
MNSAVLSTELKNFTLFKKGKVRDVYQLGKNLLIVATDRISAFDVIMPNGIPDKGKILTAISNFWFNFSKGIIKNHIISTDFDDITSANEGLEKYKGQLEGRTVLVKKTQSLPVECVVRGYLSGSGWKEYKASGSICGIKLPKGLKESDKLPEPIFTPSTKADSGHDENITQNKAADIVGKDVFDFLKKKSIEIYAKTSQYALTKGIIIADTKFEFGKIADEIIIIDEMLTPDSSRFWPKDGYSPGKPQSSFDKQFVRDYLETLDWDKTPPGPKLPEEIIKKTQQKYYQALKLITQG